MSLLLWNSKMQDNNHIRNQPRTCCNKIQFGKSKKIVNILQRAWQKILVVMWEG
jgi:hypothetical protein